MVVRVRIDLDQGAINRLAASGGDVYRQVRTVGEHVATIARIKAPVDAGRLRQSIEVEMVSRPPKVTARVKVTVNYAYVVHEGHGVIVPRRAKVLSWQAGGKRVFARRVRAVAGRPFLTDAVRDVTGKTPHRA